MDLDNPNEVSMFIANVKGKNSHKAFFVKAMDIMLKCTEPNGRVKKLIFRNYNFSVARPTPITATIPPMNTMINPCT